MDIQLKGLTVRDSKGKVKKEAEFVRSTHLFGKPYIWMRDIKKNNLFLIPWDVELVSHE